MVIPIEESLIYVRPLYLRASGGRIPELTRVIVAYENRIVMDETLEAGLSQLFGGRGAPSAPSTPPPSTSPTSTSTPPPSPEGGPDLTALAAEARAHYDRAVAAQKAGDWATYGAELQQLGQALARMRAR
jgi:hypothetical protein